MNDIEIDKRLKQTFEKALQPQIQKWIVQLTEQGLSKIAIKKEIAFQLTKRSYKLPGWLEYKTISKQELNGITKAIVEKPEYCEEIGCHELTNIYAILHRDKLIFRYASAHIVCEQHFNELRTKHVVMDQPTDNEKDMKRLLDDFDKLEAKAWVDKHKHEKD